MTSFLPTAATAQVKPLANDYVAVHESPDPDKVILYSPGLVRLESGRLVATMDVRGTKDVVKDWPGPVWERPGRNDFWQGRVYTSDDGGKTWTLRHRYPFMFARPFVAGDSLYVLGAAGDLTVIRSDDGGETWTEPAKLTDGQHWHQAPANVHYAHGKVYLVMERRVRNDIRGWYVGELAPVLMRGDVEADLTKRENWTFASEMVFEDVVTPKDLEWFGVPFFESKENEANLVAKGRPMNPIGWLEANVVQIHDPDHLWHDPNGKTFHLFMRAHTGMTGYAAMAKVIEQGEKAGTGPMKTMIEKAPSGKKMLYLPMPGGQMKFHVLYDKQTKLYWLLSTQATDSMTKPSRLGEDRYNLANNQRRRLTLHFSKNMVDWCFAGLVATGPVEKASRHYASMVFDGDDLVILSRSGDKRAKNPHDGNLITFHRIEDFRKLINIPLPEGAPAKRLAPQTGLPKLGESDARGAPVRRMWAAPRPDPSKPAAGYPVLQRAEHSLVYAGTQEAGGYNHHSQLAQHQGVFHAMWSNHTHGEDGPGQRVLYSRSTDGVHWSEAVELFPPPQKVLPSEEKGLVCTAMRWVKVDGRLYALGMLHANAGFTDATNVPRADERDKDHPFRARDRFDPLCRVVSVEGDQSVFGPVFALGENLPESGRLRIVLSQDASHEHDRQRLLTALKQPRNIPAWVPPGIDIPVSVHGPGMCEPTVYRAADGRCVMLLRDKHYAHRLFVSFSDDPTHWPDAEPTDIPDSPSLSHAINLPQDRGGGVLLVGNQMAPEFDNPDKKHYARDPLMLSYSPDGFSFDRAWALRVGTQDWRTPPRLVKGRGGGGQYPSALVHGSTLYVQYSMGKEDIWVSRVPLSDIVD